MIKAIVYTSNTGFTKQYAELLSAKTQIPALPLSDTGELKKHSDILYLGWLFADRIKGLGKAKRRFHCKAAVGVGLGPALESRSAELRKKNRLGAKTAVFYLQGGFDLKSLKGLPRAVMTLKAKQIVGDLGKRPNLSGSMKATYDMARTGYGSAVSESALGEILGWFLRQK